MMLLVIVLFESDGMPEGVACHGIPSRLTKDDSDDDWGIQWKGQQGSRLLIECGRLQLPGCNANATRLMDVSICYMFIHF